jgi:hypothetical protein
MRPTGRVDQLRSDADAVAGFAHRAFQNIADAQFATDLLYVDGLALVGKARIAGDDEEPADAGEGGDDFLDHAVGEILLLGVGTHIGERQHRDRRLIGERQSCCRRRRWALRGGGIADPIDAHRPGNVFDLLLAEILKGKGQAVAHLIMNGIGDEHPAGICQGFDPCRDVDAVAIEIVAVNDHVAEIDADAQLNAVVRRDAAVPVGHRLLHLDRATHRIDGAGKLHQQAVASGLDDAAMVLGDLWIEEFAAQRFEAFERALLIRPHQPRIPRHIGGEDRSETAGLVHVSSPATKRQPERYSSRCSGLE